MLGPHDFLTPRTTLLLEPGDNGIQTGNFEHTLSVEGVTEDTGTILANLIDIVLSFSERKDSKIARGSQMPTKRISINRRCCSPEKRNRLTRMLTSGSRLRTSQQQRQHSAGAIAQISTHYGVHFWYFIRSGHVTTKFDKHFHMQTTFMYKQKHWKKERKSISRITPQTIQQTV